MSLCIIKDRSNLFPEQIRFHPDYVGGNKYKDLVTDAIDSEREFNLIGPFERQRILEKAPEKIHKTLELARKRPNILNGASPFFTVEGQPVAPPTSFTPVANTNVETNLWTPAIWTPIGANSMYGGKLYEGKAGGVLGTSSAAPTATWTPRTGQSATPASNVTLGATTGTTMIASLSAVPWYWLFTLTIRSLGLAASGAGGTGNGFILIGGLTTAAGVVQSMGATIASTIDNTAAVGLILSNTWGTQQANNTATAQWTSPVVSLN